MISTQVFQKKFEAGLNYGQYLETGNPDQREAWNRIHASVELTADQKSLLAGFVREMRVIVVSGIWCGDCVQQGPLLQRIAEGNPDRIKLAWLDRDAHHDLAEQLKINAGMRVPVVVFAAEDNEVVSIYGDRTLTRYRAIAARQLGAHCTIPGAPADTEELAGTLQDWLNEFERVQLLLRTSARLRDIHGD